MLQDLKAGRIVPPPGVTFARLKQEVRELVASTKEIQDDDVLLHSKIESLLQQRLREKGLDGLRTLQAAWRRGLQGQQGGGSAAAGAEPHKPSVRGRPGGGEAPGRPTEQDSEPWADDAAEAMALASAALERCPSRQKHPLPPPTPR